MDEFFQPNVPTTSTYTMVLHALTSQYHLFTFITASEKFNIKTSEFQFEGYNMLSRYMIMSTLQQCIFSQLF